MRAASWRVTGPLQTKVPVTLARSVGRRLDMIGPDGRQLLSVAAVLGRRFPFAVLQAATGDGRPGAAEPPHAELTSQFVAPDEDTADWYAFAHPLMRDVLLTLLTPGERRQITGRALAAIEAVFPGPAGRMVPGVGHAAPAGRRTRPGPGNCSPRPAAGRWTRARPSSAVDLAGPSAEAARRGQ